MISELSFLETVSYIPEGKMSASQSHFINQLSDCLPPSFEIKPILEEFVLSLP